MTCLQTINNKKNKKERLKKLNPKIKNILEWAYCIIIAIVLALLVRNFIGTPTIVKQRSMYPTLKPNQRLILNRLSITLKSDIKRGEIITFEAPTELRIDPEKADMSNPVAVYDTPKRNLFQEFVYHGLEWGKTTFIKRVKGMTAFILTAVLLMGFAPFISTYAADGSHYQWDSSSENISYVDLSTYFGKYEGSFVLYDLENDAWSIHDMEHATLRVAPNSTYKIYDALFGLEEGIITPDDSLIAWSGETYPFEAWNANQTLQSAMNSSVNWYFQSVDEQLGASNIYSYIQEIGYGNENMSGDFSTYWMESSLEISPVEQVELLTRLQNNSFGFAPENINAVKDAICLSASDAGTFYGKTGTGRVDGQDVNGWFVGLLETADNTYFFATNIGADSGATGSNATEITMSILSDMNIWK